MPGAEDLQRRRREIGRGLRRSHYAVLAASGLVGLLAVAALWLSGQAQQRATEAHDARQRAEALAAEAHGVSDRLWQIGSRAAALERMSRTAGQRTRALEIIREAAAWQPSRELLDEALSALLLPDLGTNLVWHNEGGFEIAAAYDGDFEHFIQNCDHGRAIVRRAADGVVLMDEPGFGRGTPYWQFSPDGRLAGIAFFGGQLGVWDWRRTNLVGRFPTRSAEWAEPMFDFSPDGRCLWLLAPDKSLREVPLETGQARAAIVPEHPPCFVRLSPSGKFAAIACRQREPLRAWVEVWELASRRRRATLAVTNDLWRMAWHPSEERLAVGGDGAFFLWDIGAPQATELRRGGALRYVFFSADGDLLFSAGDGWEGQFWSVRERRVVLQMSSTAAALQLSPDQTRLSVAEGRVGYGVQQYLPPVGRRDWPAPPSLGEQHRGASLDPQERWVLTGHPHGWLLREADSGKELLRVRRELSGLACFDQRGSNVLAWTTEGLARWPLQVGANGTVAVLPERLFPSSVPQVWSASCFSADRRFTAYPFDGIAHVVNTADPTQRVEIRLGKSWHNSFFLSAEGRWLVTGFHNEHGLDLYDASAGKFVRTFAEEGFADPVFDAHTGRLFTCTSAEQCEWNPESGAMKRTIPWRTPAPFQRFLAFAPGGRLALLKSSPSSFQLYDLQTSSDFATLDFREPQAVYAAHWSRDGQRLFLFGNDGGITRLELPALRAELERLGLNWSDDNPSRGFGDEPEPMATAPAAKTSPAATASAPVPGLTHPARLIGLIATGLLVTIGIGLYILRYQQRLFASYLETETLAERRADELRETYAALAHSEKMKALGTMAAGVAHDFNNLLSVVRLSSELIEEQTQPEGVTRENFEAIQKAVQHGKGVVNSMLGYARDDGQIHAFTASEMISEAVALLSQPFLSGLVLQIEADAATPPLTGRKGRLEQMLLNLIVNAAEAMSGRGTLMLGARPVVSAGPCLLPPRRACGYVELFVKDSGPGIPPDVLPRIFEPFFTTKNKGAQHGTGLGLSMLYNMAKEDGLGVAVETGLGQGTTFRLFLPLEADRSLSAAALAGGRDSPIAASPEIADCEP